MPTNSKKRRGMIMVTVLLLMPICIMLGAIMLSSIISEKHFLRYERDRGQSYYLAELGVNAAYYSYSESNFSQYTHIKSNTETNPDVAGTAETDPLKVLKMSPTISAKVPFTRVSGGTWNGWYEYTWTPLSAGQPLTNSGQNETIHVRVSQVFNPPAGILRPRAWEIVCVAQLGGLIKTHRLSGDVEGIREAIFDAGDLNEFLRGQNQDIKGRVHANGDIFLKPSGTILTIDTDTPNGVAGFTTAGRFWWGVDATGRTNMGEVRLDNIGPVTSADKWPNNLDSVSATWIAQATALWGGTVRDQLLGATVRGVPPTKSFDPTGFYATTAQNGGICLRKSGGTVSVNGGSLGASPLNDAITMKTFYNPAEKKNVEAVQLDMSKVAPGDFTDPNKLLIYSERPLIIVNAQSMPKTFLNPDYDPAATPVYNPALDYTSGANPTPNPNSRQYLPVKTTVVGQSGVYTVGDTNKVLATKNDYQISKRAVPTGPEGLGLSTTQWKARWETTVPMAVMTKNRIWHLSKGYPFSGSMTAGSDLEEYPGDNARVNVDSQPAGTVNNPVIEVNALLMDGAPLYDEDFNRIVKTRADGTKYTAPKYGPDRPGDNPSAQSASWDDYLEDFNPGSAAQKLIVRKRGSIVHMQTGEMPDVTNFLASTGNGVSDSLVAWYRAVCYDPPIRDYAYDQGTVEDAPFAPASATRTMWTRK